MAEMALGIVVSLLQQAIPAAISKLKTRFQHAKATEGEFRELEDFLRSVKAYSTKYHTGGTVTTITTTTATTPSPFAKALEDVRKTLEKWSSQNSGFLSRSSADRVQELQSLRRKVDSAILLENMRMTFSMYKLRERNNDGQAQIRQSLTIDTFTAIDDPHDHNTSTTRVDALISSQVRTITTTTDKVPTHLVRSDSTGRASTIPSNPRTFSRSRSKSVQRDGHHSSEKWQTELWVPLDSEKQARDMEKILMRLPGVKKILSDLFFKKVLVELDEGSNVDTASSQPWMSSAIPG